MNRRSSASSIFDMASPVPFQQGRLLSGYGMRRGRRTGKPTYHAGVDIGHPSGRGTPVYAVEGGTVERVVDNDNPDWGFKGYGNVVVIRHDPGGIGASVHNVDQTWASYNHLDRSTVEEGQKVQAGDKVGEMGNSSTGKFPGMGVHLHLELRQPKWEGMPPFPGPYKRFNLDPKPWIEATGVRFSDRGDITLGEESEAWYTSAWRGIVSMFDRDEGKPVSGVDDYPSRDIRGFMVPESALGASPRGPDPAREYEPPEFERDVRFGLTPTEWAAAGAGGIILTSIGVGVVLMKTGDSLRRNTPGRRRVRAKKRTSKRSPKKASRRKIRKPYFVLPASANQRSRKRFDNKIDAQVYAQRRANETSKMYVVHKLIGGDYMEPTSVIVSEHSTERAPRRRTSKR